MFNKPQNPRLVCLPLVGKQIPQAYQEAFNTTFPFLLEQLLPEQAGFRFASLSTEVSLPEGVWAKQPHLMAEAAQNVHADWALGFYWEAQVLHVSLFHKASATVVWQNTISWPWWAVAQHREDPALHWPFYEKQLHWVGHHLIANVQEAGSFYSKPCNPVNGNVLNNATELSELATLPDVDLQIQALNNMLQANPLNWLAWKHLAQYHLQQNEWLAACQALTRQLNALEGEAETGALLQVKGNGLKQLAYCYQQQTMYPKALAALQQAQPLLPGDVQLLKSQAELYERVGDFDNAIISYQHALRHLPQLGSLYQALGGLYSRKGLWPQALAVYQLQLLLEPNDGWCHANIATCYLQQEQEEKAKQHLKFIAQHEECTQDVKDYAEIILMGLAFPATAEEARV